MRLHLLFAIMIVALLFLLAIPASAHPRQSHRDWSDISARLGHHGSIRISTDRYIDNHGRWSNDRDMRINIGHTYLRESNYDDEFSSWRCQEFGTYGRGYDINFGSSDYRERYDPYYNDPPRWDRIHFVPRTSVPDCDSDRRIRDWADKIAESQRDHSQRPIHHERQD